MTLLELLVQELPKQGGWPEDFKFTAQDGNGNVWLYPRTPKYNPNVIRWGCPGGDGRRLLTEKPLSSDFSSAIVTREQYEAAIKQSEWNGQGRPPVGVTCEHCPGGTTQTEWEVVTVLEISSRPGGVFTDYWLRKEDGSTYIIGNPYRFRPIRTDAERKRDEAVKKMIEFYRTSLGSSDDCIRKLYNAIIDHKIPGVTTVPTVSEIMRVTESCSREDAQKIVDLLNGA